MLSSRAPYLHTPSTFILLLRIFSQHEIAEIFVQCLLWRSMGLMHVIWMMLFLLRKPQKVDTSSWYTLQMLLSMYEKIPLLIVRRRGAERVYIHPHELYRCFLMNSLMISVAWVLGLRNSPSQWSWISLRHEPSRIPRSSNHWSRAITAPSMRKYRRYMKHEKIPQEIENSTGL